MNLQIHFMYLTYFLEILRPFYPRMTDNLWLATGGKYLKLLPFRYWHMGGTQLSYNQRRFEVLVMYRHQVDTMPVFKSNHNWLLSTSNNTGVRPIE